MISSNILSLKIILLPAIKTAFKPPEEIAFFIIMTGIAIMGIPLITVLFHMIKPWIPQKIFHFFKENDYSQEENRKTIPIEES